MLISQATTPSSSLFSESLVIHDAFGTASVWAAAAAAAALGIARAHHGLSGEDDLWDSRGSWRIMIYKQ